MALPQGRQTRTAGTGSTRAICRGLARRAGAWCTITDHDRRKTGGDRHAAAQRNLFGRLLGCLHHCLPTGQHYDENTAFPGPRSGNTRHRSFKTKRIGCLDHGEGRSRFGLAASAADRGAPP